MELKNLPKGILQKVNEMKKILWILFGILFVLSVVFFGIEWKIEHDFSKISDEDITKMESLFERKEQLDAYNANAVALIEECQENEIPADITGYLVIEQLEYNAEYNQLSINEQIYYNQSFLQSYDVSRINTFAWWGMRICMAFLLIGCFEFALVLFALGIGAKRDE